MVWPIKRKLLSSTCFGGTVYYAAQGGSNFDYLEEILKCDHSNVSY